MHLLLQIGFTVEMVLIYPSAANISPRTRYASIGFAVSFSPHDTQATLISTLRSVMCYRPWILRLALDQLYHIDWFCVRNVSDLIMDAARLRFNFKIFHRIFKAQNACSTQISEVFFSLKNCRILINLWSLLSTPCKHCSLGIQDFQYIVFERRKHQIFQLCKKSKFYTIPLPQPIVWFLTARTQPNASYP